MDIGTNKSDLADNLFTIGAIKFGEFKLKIHKTNPDAPLSPIYVDLRVLRSDPPSLHLAATEMLALTNGLSYDRIADIPLSISPVVAVMCQIDGYPMLTPRLEAKTYGTKDSILGNFEIGDVVLLVDDVCTKATSKLEAINAFEEACLIVHDVLVLVDREQGGAEELVEKGYNLHSVFKLTDLLEYYRENQMIDQAMYDKVKAYLADNK